MIVNEQVAIDHGLKKDEYAKICDCWIELQILQSLVFSQPCGMNIVLINHQDFT